jgi:uncharacterized protein (TIGR03435 family)
MWSWWTASKSLPKTDLPLTLVIAVITAAFAAQTPKFEVASIKPCKTYVPPDVRSGGGNSSPGRLNVECQTAKGLIQGAYVAFANGHSVTPGYVRHVAIEGGPSWLDSDRFEINARAEGGASHVMMAGPMMQTLLEDRFNLKIHLETREVPAYALAVAKGGPKLKPFREGSCTPIPLDLIISTFPPPDIPPNDHYCRTGGATKGGIQAIDAPATTLDDFARMHLAILAGRPVINKTGIPGRFDFHLEFAPDETPPPGEPPAGPTIFTALEEQLGLKLESTRGPGEFLVIDSISKPSQN